MHRFASFVHRRHRLPLSVITLALLAAGCGDGAAGSADLPSTTASPVAPDRDAAIALVVTDEGLAGVPVGSSTPIWTTAGAVAAPDGSAVFATRSIDGDGFEVLRVDPSTGDTRVVGRHVPGPTGVAVAAVEPGGERLILTAPTGDDTLVMSFDPVRGGGEVKQIFEGRVEPEAFSPDRQVVYAARVYRDRYHVHVLVLADGSQFPTLGPDKSLPPEDMYGDVVQAALSPDGAQLATLYRDDRSADHSAFVHLLSLDGGQTVCIDLHAPFGTGDVGADAIEWRPGGTVAVGHTAGDPGDSITASFDPAAIWGGEPQAHYHADTAVDPVPPALPDGVTGVDGFRRFIGLATPAGER